jgi:Asp-tRNA(Asn)/Glu-tRNA(Gln) amidotransferase C subunit
MTELVDTSHQPPTAHSTDRERPIRPNVITNSGDREHVLAVAEQAVASDAVWWRSGATDG